MPILKLAARKAAPVSTLRYNMDPERMIAMGSQLVVPANPKEMSDQIMTTMRLFGKGRSPDERKYYAVEIYFDPVDLQQNGGTLDAEKADTYASEFAEEAWPNREVIWIIHDHGPGIHLHFIVAACSLDTGKKLNIRAAEYRALKNGCQTLAVKHGLAALDLYKTPVEQEEYHAQTNTRTVIR